MKGAGEKKKKLGQRGLQTEEQKVHEVTGEAEDKFRLSRMKGIVKHLAWRGRQGCAHERT